MARRLVPLIALSLIAGTSEGQGITTSAVQGTIVAADGSPIAGALVQAVDINGAAVGTSAVTDEEGSFTLTVPALRDEDGAPSEGIYTLRAQAADYQEFPTALRPALPLEPAAPPAPGVLTAFSLSPHASGTKATPAKSSRERRDLRTNPLTYDDFKPRVNAATLVSRSRAASA